MPKEDKPAPKQTLTSVVMTEKRSVFGKFTDTLAASMAGITLTDLLSEGVMVTSDTHPNKRIILSPAGIAMKVFEVASA